MAAEKSRGHTGIVYPDSAPEDWMQQLEDSLDMWLISPLHEPDPEEDLETGTIKVLKPHYHVMNRHSNTISPKTARNIFADYPWIVTPKGNRYFQVGSIANLSRYFLHLDQPAKQQFPGKPEELLTVLNGFPLDLQRELTRADKRRLKKDTLTYIRERGITEYNELIDSLMDTAEWDLFDYATDHSVMIQHYLWGVREGGKNASK